MEIIALLVMLLLNNIEFDKGQTIILEDVKDGTNLVVEYQDNGRIKVGRKEISSVVPWLSVLIEENSITIDQAVMSINEFFKKYEVVEVDNGKGFDYINKVFIIRNDKMELIRSKKIQLRFKDGVVTETMEGKVIQTYKIM